MYPIDQFTKFNTFRMQLLMMILDFIIIIHLFVLVSFFPFVHWIFFPSNYNHFIFWATHSRKFNYSFIELNSSMIESILNFSITYVAMYMVRHSFQKLFSILFWSFIFIIENVCSVITVDTERVKTSLINLSTRE